MACTKPIRIINRLALVGLMMWPLVGCDKTKSFPVIEPAKDTEATTTPQVQPDTEATAKPRPSTLASQPAAVVKEPTLEEKLQTRLEMKFYPGAELLRGSQYFLDTAARVSLALATPDSIDTVVSFYEKQFKRKAIVHDSAGGMNYRFVLSRQPVWAVNIQQNAVRPEKGGVLIVIIRQF